MITARESTGASIDSAQRDLSAPPVILVVEPDPDARDLYLTALTLSGWIAEGVTDGREALAKAISRRPAAIVTETRVPCLDGLELCRLLRRDADTQHIPILVVTSEAEERRIAAAERAGADRVLIKPCVPDELVRAIAAVLSAVRAGPAGRIVKARSPAATSAPRIYAQSKLHQRSDTPPPPLRPPELLCPRCDRPLAYQRSHIGGVSARHSERWDYYECPSGCGRFQYRHRTRKLRAAHRRFMDDWAGKRSPFRGSLSASDQVAVGSDDDARFLNRIDLPMAVLRRDGFVVEHANRAYIDLVGGRHAIGQPFAHPFAAARTACDSERGSEITVRAGRDIRRVRIAVEDRGIGNTADMLPHIFEPFVQERSAVRRSRGGLELGLAIVRSLVDVHGGRVTAQSGGRGAGSTFCVDLPAAPAV